MLHSVGLRPRYAVLGPAPPRRDSTLLPPFRRFTPEVTSASQRNPTVTAPGSTPAHGRPSTCMAFGKTPRRFEQSLPAGPVVI
jgi:hypothetical protein